MLVERLVPSLSKALGFGGAAWGVTRGMWRFGSILIHQGVRRSCGPAFSNSEHRAEHCAWPLFRFNANIAAACACSGVSST
jgi:hypothetical protein